MCLYKCVHVGICVCAVCLPVSGDLKCAQLWVHMFIDVLMLGHLSATFLAPLNSLLSNTLQGILY